MDGSRRCSDCRTRWPKEWEACPRCGSKTIPNSLTPTAESARATEIVNERFETYYQEHERKRKAEGHDPEAAGRREARAVIRLDQQLGGNADATETGPATGQGQAA